MNVQSHIPRQFKLGKRSSGFSLLEIILSTAIVMTVSILSVPVGMQFYNAQTLDETAETFRSTLRTAQTNARAGLNNSDRGIALFSDRYVLFEGGSFLERNPAFDRTIFLPENVHIDGEDEVVFLQPEGHPNFSGAYTLTLPHHDNLTIVLQSNGLIE